MRRSLVLAALLVSCSPAAPAPHAQPATVVSVPRSPPSEADPTEAAEEEESEAPVPVGSSAPVSGNSRVQAQAAFEKARRMLAEGRYAEACTLFDESIQHEPAVGSYLNLGRCRELEGNVPAACQAYTEALRMSPSAARAKFTAGAMQKLGCNPP